MVSRFITVLNSEVDCLLAGAGVLPALTFHLPVLSVKISKMHALNSSETQLQMLSE